MSFGSYSEAATHLGKQGILGFYKGNTFGIMHSVLQHTLRMNAGYPLVIQESKRLTDFRWHTKFAYFFTTNTIIDLLLHPLHLAQSRFVLQNRRVSNCLYRSIPHFFASHRGKWRGLWNGWEANVPMNLLIAGSYCMMQERQPYLSMALSLLSSTLFLYPFHTMMRRRECLADERGMVAGRLPPFLSHLRTIWSTEGVRGFYHGFGGFLAVNIMLFTIGLQLQRHKPQY